MPPLSLTLLLRLPVATLPPVAAGGRVLWIGHPDVLPLGSHELADGLSFAVSGDDAFPTVAQRWAGVLDDRTRMVGQAVLDAPAAGAKRLGAELSQWDIGTILVAERLAPAPYGELTQPAPQWLFDMLDGQLDLAPGALTAGIATYENTAADPSAHRPGRGSFSPMTALRARPGCCSLPKSSYGLWP